MLNNQKPSRGRNVSNLCSMRQCRPTSSSLFRLRFKSSTVGSKLLVSSVAIGTVLLLLAKSKKRKTIDFCFTFSFFFSPFQSLIESSTTARLGFFLHIPFPPWDIFRLLPWDDEILLGMLGSFLSIEKKINSGASCLAYRGPNSTNRRNRNRNWKRVFDVEERVHIFFRPYNPFEIGSEKIEAVPYSGGCGGGRGRGGGTIGLKYSSGSGRSRADKSMVARY